MGDNAAAFTGSIPDDYDRRLGPVIFVDFADAMARRAAAHSPARVLETAAGTGFVTRRLRDALPAGTTLTATDLNPPMLAVARGKFAPAANLTFEVADATDLPFADGAFDAVVCQFGIMFFPEKARGNREAHRVLESGGHYFFSVWDAHRYNPFGRIANEVVRRFFPADPPRFYQVPFGSHAIDPIKESLIDAGFTGIKAEVLTLDKEIGEPANFARGLIYGNPMIEEIRGRGGDPDAIVTAVAEALRDEMGLSRRLALQTIFFEATKR